MPQLSSTGDGLQGQENSISVTENRQGRARPPLLLASSPPLSRHPPATRLPGPAPKPSWFSRPWASRAGKSARSVLWLSQHRASAPEHRQPPVLTCRVSRAQRHADRGTGVCGRTHTHTRWSILHPQCWRLWCTQVFGGSQHTAQGFLHMGPAYIDGRRQF